ncbi:hypothetical protein FisN_23Hh086 [Fistulifera solaris]|uniref:SET domain-containing protein n=1 Tax=Fistulifera solaris TaxID=1519565 RepID=A0A1Z5KM98_FISSO|nr:hypothetical protein FisN_23Hh086 [Fistulifera solaris]|eukprot:GAX27450.1 hypothetical protein FisN_23Hh086 [Fistulifera solaris]
MRVTHLLISVTFLLAESCFAFSSQAKGFGTQKKTASYTVTEEALTNFLKSKKANIQNVDIGIDSNGQRGLFAAKTFGKSDALICKIPSDIALALLDPQKVASSDEGNVAEYGHSFYRQYYTKPDDWWKDYLQSLPSRIIETSTTPNLWSDSEIDLLEFPRLVQQAKKRRDQIEELARKENIPLDDLKLATWLVTSRAFLIPIADDNQETVYDDRGQVITKTATRVLPVMVPFIDIANHSSNPNAKLTLLDPEKDEAFFCLTSTRPIPKGTEITIGYGSGVASSVELLLNYGFVAPGNQLDRFMLKKGGDDCLALASDWTTSLEDDQTMLKLLNENPEERNDVLRQILSFRIQLKESYSTEE